MFCLPCSLLGKSNGYSHRAWFFPQGECALYIAISTFFSFVMMIYRKFKLEYLSAILAQCFGRRTTELIFLKFDSWILCWLDVIHAGPFLETIEYVFRFAHIFFWWYHGITAWPSLFGSVMTTNSKAVSFDNWPFFIHVASVRFLLLTTFLL